MIKADEIAEKKPNPQGKGLVPVLAALNDANQRIVALPKHVQQISNELFTSMFVLESCFGFKPVVGRSYWLYRNDERFSLSLLEPGQWSATVYGQYIGACEVHDDLTWTLTLSEQALRDEVLMAEIAQRRQQFEQTLQSAEAVDDLLPVFKEELPFYQRVFASALAGSLGASMQASGINGLSYDEAMGLLTVKQP
ncbi:MAG: DUF2452 domain-containing protein [Thiolinea sp.]